MKVLSIDLDYIMGPTIETYQGIQWDENENTRWEFLYENTDFKESTLNQNKDSFKSIKDHQIEIVLREGNVLCLPNNWSFYNKYISDTLFLTYTFNTITSKVVNLFN